MMNNGTNDTICLHNPAAAAATSDKKDSIVDRWAASQDTKKAESIRERVARRKEANAAKVEKLHSDVSLDIPKHSTARPKGRIAAVNLRSSSSLMGGRPMIFTLDRRHRLSVESNVNSLYCNEYVACLVMGGGKFAGMVLVRRRDIEIEKIYEGNLN